METTIDYAVHAERADLSGRDLMSVFGRSRDEVAASTGLAIAGVPLRKISVPAAKVTSMAGEVADEVHEWPNASQGASFRSLGLHFRDGALIALEWNFSLADFLPRRKPWYRRWF